MSTNDEETFWVLEENDAFIARKVSGWNFRFKKGKGKGKSTSNKGSHQQGGFKPFRKGSSGKKANMANESQDPYDYHQAYWGKGKRKKGKKGKSKFQYPYMMETKVIHPMTMAKEKADKKKENPKRLQPAQEEQPAIQQTAPSTEPTYAGWTDQDPSGNWNEQGCYSSHRHPAQDKR